MLWRAKAVRARFVPPIAVREGFVPHKAEGARFELAKGLLPYRFSRPVHSTALPPFRFKRDCDL